MRTLFSKFFAALAFMVIGLFIACGGGGGGSTPTPPPAPSTYSVSGTVSGSVLGGVSVSIAPTPTGVAPWVTTDSKGFYAFANVPNGTYVLTPYMAWHTFTPTSATIVVSGKDMTGVNFNSPLPQLNTGKLLYVGNWASPLTGVYTKDLATGVETLLWSTFGTDPDMVVPLRGSTKKAAFRTSGSALGGIYTLSLADRISLNAIPVGGTTGPSFGYLSTTLGNFDVVSSSVYGAYAVVTLENAQGKNVFLLLMDGSLGWSQVTTNGGSSPVIISADPVTGDTTVLFIKNGNEVWKQSCNLGPAGVPGYLIGPATLYLSGVMDSTRPMSVNADYTLLAYMKNVSGVAHVVVKTLASGAEVDLGPGSDPSWSFNGNGMLLFNNGGALWAVNPDGTGKIQVPTPTNMVANTLASVVFGPAGF